MQTVPEPREGAGPAPIGMPVAVIAAGRASPAANQATLRDETDMCL
jgi:hypothetical protein